MRLLRSAADFALLGGARVQIPFGSPIVLIGDSITGQEFTVTTTSFGGTFYSSGGPFCWANAELGTPFQLTAASQKGVPGNQIDAIDARFVTDTAGFKYVRLAGGIDDFENGRSAAQCMPNFLSIFAKAAAAGQILFIRPPLKTTILSAGLEAQRVLLVAWLLSQANGRTIFVAADPALYDPSVHTTGDGVHPDAMGAMIIAATETAVLAPLLKSGSFLFQSGSDPANLMTNGFLSGTGGILGTNTSGVLAGDGVFGPGNYLLDGSNSGGAVAACSIVAGAHGNKQRFAISGAKTGTNNGFILVMNGPNFTPAMDTTSIFEATCAVDLAAGAAGIKAIDMQLFIWNGDLSQASIGSSLAQFIAADALQNRAASPVLRAPATMAFATPTQLQWQLGIFLTDGALTPSAQIDISQLGIRKLQ